MTSDIDMDIDGRDPNGNPVGGYGSCYVQGLSSDLGSSEPYVHVVPTKEQVYASRLQSYRQTLETRRAELSMFNKYTAEALKEYETWNARISDKKQEIADLETYIEHQFGVEP
jgi:chromosome segregation ATPase